MIVIFDLEGVLTQTMGCYIRSWKLMALEQGITLEVQSEQKHRFPAQAEMMKKILRKSHRNYSQAEQMALLARQGDIYDELLLEAKDQSLQRGARDVLHQLRAAGVSLGAVANGALPGRMLGALPEKRLFQAVSREEDFSLQLSDVARRLKAEHAACLLVTAQKDSVVTAKEMGMKVLKIGEDSMQADLIANHIQNVFWRQAMGDMPVTALK